MEAINVLLLFTSFVLASCRAESVGSVKLADNGVPFPLVPRRLEGLSPESTANSIIFPSTNEATWRSLSSAVHLMGELPFPPGSFSVGGPQK